MLKRLSIAILSLCILCISSCVPYVGDKFHFKPKYYTEYTTIHGVRLRQVVKDMDAQLNIVWVPGGPGMDSAYLTQVAENISLPANVWLLDMPESGTNRQAMTVFNQWPFYLLQAVSTIDNVVLVGHSYGGMLMLSQPGLDAKVKAMVLLNTSPINPFQAASHGKYTSLPLIEKRLAYYLKKPSDYRYKKMVMDMADYYFTPPMREQGRQMLKRCSFNYYPFEWHLQHFFPYYRARYVPTVPTLILSGAHDPMNPSYLWKQELQFEQANFVHRDIPNAGHFPWVEQPLLVKQQLEHFLVGLLAE